MTADRSNLQRVHGEFIAALDRLAKIERALDGGWGDLAERRAVAERNLADARNAEPTRWVDALVEGKPRPDAVALAEAACSTAIAAEENFTAQRRMLRAEAQRQQDVVGAARRRLRLEITAFVSASPEAQAMVAELEHCEKRAAEILAVAGAVLPGAIPIGHRVIPGDTSKVDMTLAHTWAAAVTALEADPTAALPSATDAPLGELR
jgi:hypothetical protein